MTHQEIADRADAVEMELAKLEVEFKKAHEPERDALRMECAKIGHIFKHNCWHGERRCLICLAPEPKAAA